MFYTYIWFSENDVPFYVGKGVGNRFSSHHGRSDDFLKKIKSQKCYVRIDDIFTKEHEAIARENELIERYGRIDKGGVLYNKQAGSEMASWGEGDAERWTKDAIESAIDEFKKIASSDNNIRMLRIDRVLDLIPVSRVSLYRMMKAGQFPLPVKLGGSSAWSNQEVRKWRDNLLASRTVLDEAKARRRKRDMSDLV